ncbi:MAG: PilN domain-containing protein [Planctomycetes bacterium]|nr:PilN domain-containing protein [Planctomycetota bacterium]
MKIIESVFHLNGVCHRVLLSGNAQFTIQEDISLPGELNSDTFRKLREEGKGPFGGEVNQKEKQLIWGFDSTHVMTTTMELPEQDHAEMESIVKIQMENILPVPVEELAFHWRASGPQSLLVTIKKKWITGQLDTLRHYKPNKVILNGEAVARAYQEYAQKPHNDCLLLWWHDDTIEMLRLKKGQLVFMRCLHAEKEEMSSEISREHIKEDLLAIFDELGLNKQSQIIMIPSSAEYAQCFSMLEYSRLELSPCHLKKLDNIELDHQKQLTLLPALGHALLTEPKESYFNVFRDHYTHSVKKQFSGNLYYPVALFALALLCILGYYYLEYQLDLKKLKALQLEPEIQKQLDEKQRVQNYQKLLISERPDIIDFIQVIQPKGIRGVTLTEVQFKKGQQVKISGTTKNDEYYKYMEELQKNKSLSNITLHTPVYNKQKRMTSFSLTFKYKGWSQKAKSRRGVL